MPYPFVNGVPAEGGERRTRARRVNQTQRVVLSLNDNLLPFPEPAEHALVAGELDVPPGQPERHPRERIEPMNRRGKRRENLEKRVKGAYMPRLMRRRYPESVHADFLRDDNAREYYAVGDGASDVPCQHSDRSPDAGFSHDKQYFVTYIVLRRSALYRHYRADSRRREDTRDREKTDSPDGEDNLRDIRLFRRFHDLSVHVPFRLTGRVCSGCPVDIPDDRQIFRNSARRHTDRNEDRNEKS